MGPESGGGPPAPLLHAHLVDFEAPHLLFHAETGGPSSCSSVTTTAAAAQVQKRDQFRRLVNVFSLLPVMSN